MAPLREYTLTINGSTTTMLLSEEDAARLGALLVAAEIPERHELVEGKARKHVANKARTTP